jgi:hypothetical protein
MNANRRLEEFILKLNTRQNEHGLFDKINEMKLTSYFKDLTMSKDNSDNKSNNKFACSIDKE